MSTRKKKNPASKQPTPDPTADPAPAAPVGEQGAGVPVPRTDTEKAVWAALGNYPGFTIDELAGAAGVAGSTARRILTAWETAGVARSHRDPESPRAAKTWTTAEQATTHEPAAPETVAPETVAAEPTQPASVDGTEPDPSAPADTGQPDTAVAAPTGDEPAAPAPDAPAPDAAAAQPEPTERLAPGALRGQVEDFLRDHPGQDYTPHQVGKALDKSSGAVHNALVKLTTGGIARQTCAAPKKFALADA
ncbi:hypothetical protein [Nocardia anaemiae]|uniref:hypothetical protein n=1 Tax=Nocardia anaemiae TaxID=263910 RepID=UPI000B116194|nr:hypothetical protein [Nocardia anaemiae]